MGWHHRQLDETGNGARLGCDLILLVVRRLNYHIKEIIIMSTTSNELMTKAETENVLQACIEKTTA